MSSSFKLSTVPLRPITRQQVRNYFAPRPIPWWTIIAIIIGIVIFISAGIVRNIEILILGFLPLLIGIVMIYTTLKSNPNDEEYDRWLESESRALFHRGLQALGLQRQELTDTVLRTQSYILPGTFASEDYTPQQLKTKQGKDGKWRFSIYSYTYIYPTESFLAIFRSDINAFSQDHVEQHETYQYKHILSAMTYSSRDKVTWSGKSFPYRTEQLCLRLANGDMIEWSAAVKAKPQDSQQTAPFGSLNNESFDKTLNRLRLLLHSK